MGKLVCFEPGDDILYAAHCFRIGRIAIHTGDLSAICTDIAYQLAVQSSGDSGPRDQYLQVWCGNRLAKGLIRAGKILSGEFRIRQALSNLFDAFEPDFNEMYQRMKPCPVYWHVWKEPVS